MDEQKQCIECGSTIEAGRRCMPCVESLDRWQHAVIQQCERLLAELDEIKVKIRTYRKGKT